MLQYIKTETGYASKCGRFRLTVTKRVDKSKLYTVTWADNGQQIGPSNLTLREAKKACQKIADN